MRSFVGKLVKVPLRLVPDRLFISMSHKRHVGHFPNLDRPSTFNEKILDLCLNPDPSFARLTDKILVRDHVAQTIGAQYLIPMIATPDQFTEQVFRDLPNAFVMKANHGSGYNKVVQDKSKTSFEELKSLADRWLRSNFYRHARERHYNAIQPKLLFETLLLDKTGRIPADYKCHCFNHGLGEPTVYISVIQNRLGIGPRGDLYDAQWNRLNATLGSYLRSNVPEAHPRNLDLMLELALKLSSGFGHVRVDLYAPDDQVYFGELTFTPGAGVFKYQPESIDREWGRLMPNRIAPDAECIAPLSSPAA